MKMLLSFALLFAAWQLARPANAAEPTEVLSYNIRFMNTSDGQDVWPNRKEKVIETIATGDIVGLQEVVAQQLSDIQAGTPDFQWYGRGRDDGEQKGEMTPIGWRSAEFSCEDQGTFWLSENPSAVGEKSWDAALPRIASWVKLRRQADGAQVLVVNTHFDHVGREARRQAARQLRKWISEQRGELPAILLGDLNAKLEDAPLAELLEADKQATAAPLVDALSVTTSEPTGPNSTWNGFKEIVPGQRIDHILLAGEITVTAYQTLDPRTESGRFASDHMPIQVTVIW
jgi:endonuclease/exonuclease/phosphatase family metal-dependent hydrolase